MLLFKPEHVRPILSGEKTETRRIWKRRRVKPGALHQARTRMLDRDSTFAILEADQVWQERLGDIDEEGARREGYGTRNDYLRKFAEINGTESLALEVWAVRFHVWLAT